MVFINFRSSSAGYTHKKAAQKSTKEQVAWLHLWLCLVPSRTCLTYLSNEASDSFILYLL